MPFDIFGGVNCVYLFGDLDPQGQLSTEITRAGVDGRAWRLTSNKGETTTLQGMIDCDGMEDSDSTISDLKSLQGTTITITLLRSGITLDYENYFVEEIGGWNRKSVGSPIGGTQGGNVLLTFKAQVSYAGNGS